MSIHLFVNHTLAPDATIPLTGPQSHYLTNVMRRKTCDAVHVFNGRQGLWAASINTRTSLVIHHLFAPQTQPRRILALAFSPIKQQNWLIEKATELGVTDLYPIMCQHTTTRHFSHQRHMSIIYEACEQSRRLHIPTLHPVQKLHDFVQSIGPETMPWTILDIDIDRPLIPTVTDAGLCVGPEGGWSASERAFMRTAPAVQWASLGNLVLRAETAALAGLAKFLSYVFVFNIEI
jgi:16S rRNA (uracil1498-N3)-methyltransferase